MGGEPGKIIPISKTLVSWKEIASYLKVTPRTAQEWEKERGLPVHREGNPLKPTVVAYPLELDRWREQARLIRDGAARPAEPGKSSRTRLVLLLGLLIVLTVILWPSRPEPGLPAFCRLEGPLLKAFDRKGDLLWSVETPHLDLNWSGTGRHFDTHQVIDLDGDGRPEVLFNVRLSESSPSYGKLICFDSAGKVRWEYRYGRVKRWDDRVFNDHYLGRLVRHISSGGRNYVLAAATHNTFFPCQVSLLDAITGELVSEYWHPGWLTAFAYFDLDGDGEPEILLGGTNNPGVGCLGHAALVALKVPFSAPRDYGEEESARKFGGGEFQYGIFPAAGIFRARNQTPIVNWIAHDMEDSFSVQVWNEIDGSLNYRLDKSFRPSSVEPCDRFVRNHRELRREGRLRHDLALEIAGLNRVFLYDTAPPCHNVR
jgi:hypothetical protein